MTDPEHAIVRGTFGWWEDQRSSWLPSFPVRREISDDNGPKVRWTTVPRVEGQQAVSFT